MSVQAKARTLLTTGRVRVVEVAPGVPARVEVEGDHGRYEVVVGNAGAVCSCPAYTRLCSHAIAASLVVMAEASS